MKVAATNAAATGHAGKLIDDIKTLQNGLRKGLLNLQDVKDTLDAMLPSATIVLNAITTTDAYFEETV
jgi:hypothetical protein